MTGKRFTYSIFRIIGENIRFFRLEGQAKNNKLYSNFGVLQNSNDNFSTSSPQKLWKIQKACQAMIVLALLVTLLPLCGCATKKAAQIVGTPGGDAALIGKTEDEVKKILGEPNVVSKTPENRILWVYNPSWRIVPSPRNTVYVEFDNGQVVKVFKIK